MLFKPEILIEQPLQTLAVIAIIIIGKSLAAMAGSVLPLSAQYRADRFSESGADRRVFLHLLAGLGLSLGLLLAEGMSLILAGADLDRLNPFMFAAIAPLQRWLLEKSELARQLIGARILMPNCR